MFIAWGIVFVIIFFAFIAFMSILRAVMKLRRNDEPPVPPLNVDFAIADLHELLAKGQISREEFEQLKHALLMRDM